MTGSFREEKSLQRKWRRVRNKRIGKEGEFLTECFCLTSRDLYPTDRNSLSYLNFNNEHWMMTDKHWPFVSQIFQSRIELYQQFPSRIQSSFTKWEREREKKTSRLRIRTGEREPESEKATTIFFKKSY